MSHTVKSKSKTTLKDRAHIVKAAKRLGYKVEEVEKFKLYQPKTHKEKALAVTLQGWKYPVYITEDSIISDNYGGSWGSSSKLDELLNVTVAEKQIKKAKAAGYSISKYEISKSGDVKLVITA